MRRSRPVGMIVLALLFGTSLWFSPSSAAPDLIRTWQPDRGCAGAQHYACSANRNFRSCASEDGGGGIRACSYETDY